MHRKGTFGNYILYEKILEEMKMKKILSVLLVLAMVFSLVACGNDDKADDKNNGNDSSNVDNNDTDDNDTDDNDDAAQINDVELSDLRAAVVEALGEDNYWPNAEVPEEMIEDTFGLTSDMYDDFFGETPMISANVDAFVL